MVQLIFHVRYICHIPNLIVQSVFEDDRIIIEKLDMLLCLFLVLQLGLKFIKKIMLELKQF